MASRAPFDFARLMDDKPDPNMIKADGVGIADAEAAKAEEIKLSKAAAAPKPAAGDGRGGGAGGAKPTPAAGKPMQVTPAAPTRMGVGPGGPAMGFDEAYNMLNAPQTLGQVEAAGAAAGQQGQQMADQFRQAAGGPIGFGQQEKQTLQAAVAPGQASTETQGKARDVLFRKYGGPLALGQKTSREEGLTDATKTRFLGEEAQDIGNLWSKAAGRSAGFQQAQALGSGSADREAQRAFERGEGVRAAKFSAQQGVRQATFAEQLAASQDYGQQQQQAARKAGEEARVWGREQQQGIVDKIGGRVEKRKGEIAESTQAVADFQRTGNREHVKDYMNASLIHGDPAYQAMDRYNEIQNDPRFAGIKQYDDFVAQHHYTGKLMYSVTDNTRSALMEDDRFKDLVGHGVFENMGEQDSGTREPGAWLKTLLDIASSGIWVANPDWHMGSREPMKLKNGPDSKEAQAARVMSQEFVSPMIERTRMFEADFNIAHNTDPRGRGIGRSIMTPDQLVAQDWRKGPYYDQHIGVGQGDRGRHAYVHPKIGAQGQTPTHIGQFMQGQFRQPTVNTQAKDYEIEQFGDWEGLYGGQSAIGGEEAVDTGIQFDQAGYDQYWNDFRARRDEELTQAETDLRENVNRERDEFLAGLSRAEGSIFSHSRAFKDLPEQTRGGIRGPLDAADFGIPSEGEELVA